MFKNFAIAFVGAFITLIVVPFVPTTVYEVEGLNMMFQCAHNTCIELGDSVYVLKK